MQKESDHTWIKTVKLSSPTLKDNTADAERLIAALRNQVNAAHIKIGYPLLKQLPELIRRWDDHVRCVLFKDQDGWTLIDIEDPLDIDIIPGIAVDLGTTRVVMRLVDLVTGEIKGELSFDNPQISIGPDILERIHFAHQPEGLVELQRLIIEAFNRNIDALSRSSGVDPDCIPIVSVAGNTSMTHLFLGLPPKWIIREPYIPVVNNPGLIDAEALDLKINPFGKVFVFPNVGSYFGGDLIAGILSSGLARHKNTAILVDVGTNAEVVLGNQDWLIACAGAAGPALEGGVSKMGMMAGPGVIDRIKFDPASGQWDIHTIDEKPPKGICGSGVIDLAAQLFLAGIIDFRGKLKRNSAGERVKEKDGMLHFVVVPSSESGTGTELTISQADIASLVRSKAAMYTILETITRAVGVEFQDLAAFFVAGTFGSFINPRSAINIGMLPDLPLERYVPLGNSSLEGATMAILDCRAIDEIRRISDLVTYMELNVNQEFMNRFSAAKFFPHTERGLFPSVP